MTLKLPKGVDWSSVGVAVYRIFIAGMAIGGMYAASVFATHGDIEKAQEPFKDVPARVATVERAVVENLDSIKQLNDWRVKKDEIDTRLTVLVENQQRLLDRQQQMMDRQQTQIDLLNSRK